MTASDDLSGLRTWILTDGKAGDETQCIGLAERLGVTAELRRVAPRAPWSWLAPRGPVDPRERPSRAGSPIRPPWPDLLIATGRRAVPYMRLVRERSGLHTFTVFLKDPRTDAAVADLIWVPEHDDLRGPNVITSLTSPHRVSPERLAAARQAAPVWLAKVTAPRVAVLLGGNSKHHMFGESDIRAFSERLGRLSEEGAGLMLTASRRTPDALRTAVETAVARHGGWFWDGEGENPYLGMLAHADAIVVTADSVNMVGEAVATGVPVFVFEPSGGHRKIRYFLDELTRRGFVRPFDGPLTPFAYEPLDATPMIAAAIRERLLSR